MTSDTIAAVDRTVTLEFRPMSCIPTHIFECIVMGGEENSGVKLRPYGLAEAWRDADGRWWVGKSCEIEIINPTHWAVLT